MIYPQHDAGFKDFPLPSEQAGEPEARCLHQCSARAAQDM